MDHRGSRRLAGAVLALVAVGLVVAVPAPALAQGAEQIDITGIGLDEPLEVSADDRPELCAALYREVAWLVGDDPVAEEPDADTLGPQYTLVAHVDGEPRHRFHLYPLAEGGPRAFRPVEQPGDRTAKEGWFHGRVGMPETLASAGVPLDGIPGSDGTGGGDPAPEGEAEADSGVLGFLDDWREGMQLTAAVTVAIALGLAGVALLLRRRA